MSYDLISRKNSITADEANKISEKFDLIDQIFEGIRAASKKGYHFFMVGINHMPELYYDFRTETGKKKLSQLKIIFKDLGFTTDFKHGTLQIFWGWDDVPIHLKNQILFLR